VIRSKKKINVKEPSQWSNLDVVIDQNPHGNYNWNNKVLAKVVSLIPNK
jgi:hypothetical protein